MQSTVPKKSPLLMKHVFGKIFPQVDHELNYWKARASAIPDSELRTQALASIQSKKFHCQGGGVYSMLAEENWEEAIRFIVAYQTISDYLDNLCDRSTSLDPKDFRQLHTSMEDALMPDSPLHDYYAHRQEKQDAGYLAELVSVCQRVLHNIEAYPVMRKYILELEQLYSDLQVHKHVNIDERVPRLENWFKEKNKHSGLSWFEFSACSGSTLGIFCLVSYGLGEKMNKELAEMVMTSYFPFMQGLHIMLDYYIDQEEDRLEGDLNFCNYYENEEKLKERLLYFITEANRNVQKLPDRLFHEMVHNGLVGLYLADPKVKQLKGARELTKTLLQASGRRSAFFHLNIKVYNKLKR